MGTSTQNGVVTVGNNETMPLRPDSLLKTKSNQIKMNLILFLVNVIIPAASCGIVNNDQGNNCCLCPIIVGITFLELPKNNLLYF